MTRTLLWDDGPGEVHAGLLEGGKLTEFRIIRKRRNAPNLAAGEVHTARIGGRISNGATLVTLGGGAEALLQPSAQQSEGSLVAVVVSRAAIPEPGGWKRAVVRLAAGVESRAEPGWHGSVGAEARLLAAMAEGADAIICPDAYAAVAIAAALPDCPVPIRIDPSAIDDADFDTLIEHAVAGEFAIDGGRISVERTRAMTVIDVDGDSAPRTLNLSAARAIPQVLRLLDIKGPVGIDFVTLNSRAERLELDAALAEAAFPLGPNERTAINGFGFCQLVRARLGPSVPEILCETTPARLSVESRALALLRAARRAQGQGTRQLVGTTPVIDLLRTWPEDLATLQSRFGVPFELVSDPAVSGYGYVHVSPA